MSDRVAPHAVLCALYKKHGVSKTRLVDKKRLQDVFDEKKLENLLAQLAAEDKEERIKLNARLDANKARMDKAMRETFLEACPPGDVVLSEFSFEANGGLEHDKIQRFYGPRDDVANEFETEFTLDVVIKGTHDGEAFRIWVDFDLYQDMDVGVDKVHLETEWRKSCAVIPPKFGKAVLALCEGLPEEVLSEIFNCIVTDPPE